MPELEKTVQETQKDLSLLLMQLVFYISKNTKITFERDDPNAVRAYFTPPITEEQKKTRRKKKKLPELALDDLARLKNSLPQQTHFFDIFRVKVSCNIDTYRLTVQNGKRQMMEYCLFPYNTNSAFFSNETHDYLEALFDRYHSPQSRSRKTINTLKNLLTMNIEPNFDTDAWDTEHIEVIYYLQSIKAKIDERKEMNLKKQNQEKQL